MAGYIRQSVADIINGAEITAPPLNAEFNQLVAAFNASSGHTHTGATGDAPKISLTTSVSGVLPAANGGTGGANKMDATTAPATANDNTQGYAPGSLWENVSNGRVYICVGNATGAAVWRELVTIFTNNKIEPAAHNTVDLGTPTVRFQDLFLQGGIAAAGNTALGGTLNVTGASTLNSLTVTNATTMNSIAASGNVTVGGTLTPTQINIDAGTIDGAVIGGSSAQAVTGTVVTATTNFAGDLTGNVTGNLTGNVTGNVTGDITGDVTGNVTAASGTSSFNNLTVNGTLNMNAGTSATIENLSAPVNANDAARKIDVDNAVAGLVDSAPDSLNTLNELAAALADDDDAFNTLNTAIGTKLPKAGGTMTGSIAMSTNKITGAGDPTAAQDVSTKAYTDAQRDTRLPLAGGTMTGGITMGANKVTATYTPSANSDLTTKTYVDGILGSATVAATSASNAATSATNAATSASAASSSATAAATSETNAGTSETNALASKTAANTSATNAASSASAASTSATNAATSETNAATSATNASNSATAAATSATNAATSETNAASSATAAGTSATNAATSETNAASSATAAAASYDNFDDRYLGAKSSAPSTDNDGDALVTGALYWNSTSNGMYAWTGSAWVLVTNYNDAAVDTHLNTGTAASGEFLSWNGSDYDWATVSTVGGSTGVDFNDNVKARFGTGNDLEIYHGTDNHSYIKESGSGNLRIMGQNLRLQNASGADYLEGISGGAVKIMHNSGTKLETTSSGIKVTGDAELYGDAPKLTFNDVSGGTQIDFSLQANNGTFTLTDETNSDTVLTAAQNGAVSVYHNNAVKLATSSSGVTVTGTLAATALTGDGSGLTNLPAQTSDVVDDTSPQLGGDLDANNNAIRLGDNSDYFGNGSEGNMIIMGADEDFRIFKGATNNYIRSENGGNLLIQGHSQVTLTSNTGENMAQFTKDGSARLFHNGSKKVESTSTGADITGDITFDGSSDEKVGAESSRTFLTGNLGSQLRAGNNTKVAATTTGVELTGTVTVSGAYTLPTSDGSANQVLTTNGSGAVTFADAGGGGGADLYAAETTGSTDPTASGTLSIAIGSSAIATGNDSIAIGNGADVFNSWTGAVAIGPNSGANGAYSLAIGEDTSTYSGTTGSLAIGQSAKAVSQRCVAIGKSRANQQSSFAAVIDNNSSSYGTNGANSIGMGYQAKATASQAFSVNGYAQGTRSIAIGASSHATSTYGCAIGYDTTAVGSALALGTQANAQAGYSVAIHRGKAEQRGKIAFSGGIFATQGDAQGGQFVLLADTTDATATVLTSNNGSASTDNQIVAASDTCITFDGTITAMQNGAQAYASWKIEGLLVNDGGTTTLVNSATTVISNADGWGMALSADNTNNALAITCTGEASHNIRWVANIRTTEVTYA